MFSIPILVANVFQQLYSLVDLFIINRFLGIEAGAAIAPVGFLLQFSIIMAISSTIGVTVLVSNAFGANNQKKIHRITETGMLLFLLISIIIGCIGTFFSPIFLRWMNIPNEILPLTYTYGRISFIGTPLLIGYNFFGALYRGVGDSKIPFRAAVVSTILNIFLDIISIRFLGMGIEGPAWSTNISQAIGLIMMMIALKKRHPIFTFNWIKPHWENRIALNILKIGFPIGVKDSLYFAGFLSLTSLVGSYGVPALTAFSIATRIDTFIQAPMGSLGYGFSAFVSQNLGSRKIDRVREGLHSTWKLGVIISIGTTILIWLLSEPIARLFSNSPNVNQLLIKYLRIVSICYVIYGISEITSGIAMGSGQTRIMMLSCVVAMWVVRIPLAFILSKLLNIGIVGVWISIPSGWFVALGFNYYVYVKRKWEKNTFSI
ncbi:MAG: MATE family efflux transporter [Sphaerochaetaceae bacterium]|nr:MATE family efflux transporter [Sphaerochaetaceae bacterium]